MLRLPKITSYHAEVWVQIGKNEYETFKGTVPDFVMPEEFIKMAKSGKVDNLETQKINSESVPDTVTLLS